MKKAERTVLILLAMAQLILTLDSTVMNVSISTLVKDLNTTVSAVQSAIAFYTLVMAAFMIAGAKIGDVIGRKKAFVIGLIIYGTGSFITSIAPNIAVLKLGWSLLEGLGAALVVPAMISLIAGNFEAGPKRAKAYGMLAAMAGIGAAIGPIVGDLLATGWSELSFNHRIGRALARGKKIDKLNSEGVNALRQIPLVIKTKQYPVLHILRQIFSHKVPVSDLSEVIAIA